MGVKMFYFHIFFIVWFMVVNRTCSESLQEKITVDPDLQQFYGLLSKCNICNYTLEYETLTVFAPINAAFQKTVGQIHDPDFVVQYHLINMPRRISEFKAEYSSVNTRLAGAPPIWITISSGKYEDGIYVNNAKLLVSQSDITGIKDQSRGPPLTQMLHKIDDILFPTRSPATSTHNIFNPNAWEFLDNYEYLFIQGDHRVRIFREKVQQYGKEDVFRQEGGHTFFIPVDDGFSSDRKSHIDSYIIDGHVIPKKVLFTTPTKKDSPFLTSANVDNAVRVVISFTQEKRDNTIINYVKSHTILGDGKHPQGVVLAEIVKANIPVKNGVIHLIHKPLMVVDSTISELLRDHMDYICNVGNVQSMENVWSKEPATLLRYSHPTIYPYIDSDDDKDGGLLNNFLNEINTHDPDGRNFMRIIEKSQDVTLFAPCNSALDSHLVMQMKNDKQKFLDILKMHVVVDKRLYVDTVKREVDQGVHQFPTLIKGKNLYFNIKSDGTNRSMTVEGGGVNATVIQPDLVAKNGIIHIIDRVLGVPYNNILEKVATDPMLSKSYWLGSKLGFNAQLNATNKMFTYFVPRDKAWIDASVALPSAVKVLFMDAYAYHGLVTLQRHLVVSNEVFTMERIKALTEERRNRSNHTIKHQPPTVELPAMRGSLKIFVEEKMDKTYIIHWEGLQIPVFRANVECTNGIIHVIDKPFLKDGDIRISSATIFAPSTILSLMAFALARMVFD